MMVDVVEIHKQVREIPSEFSQPVNNRTNQTIKPKGEKLKIIYRERKWRAIK